ncbi:MAG: DNA repair protein RecO [Candidatus Neomarinimicrobiota bacterium]|nr:MAG: DNA repair protein RecO [Candidatus Neomarinimicrobiota bacterium]
MVQRSPAIVIKTIPYGETSLVVRCYTRDRGKMGLLAKGARRKKSPLVATFQSGNYLEIFYTFKANRDLQILTQAGFMETWTRRNDDLKKLGYSLTVIELLDQSVTDLDPHPEIFDAVVTTLRAINSQDRGLNRVFWRFQVQLLTYLGFRPDLRQRTIQGVSLPDPAAGPHSLPILESILNPERVRVPPERVTAADRKAIQDYLSACFRAHLEGFTGLKSFRLLKEFLG